MDFLEEELEEILNIFREEGEELIEKLNQGLLKLETDPTNPSIISELFRNAHSIKGASRMVGLNDIQNLAHKIEDILGFAKEKTLIITDDIIDKLCKAVDCISSIVEESVQTKGECHSPLVDEIVAELGEIGQKTDDVPIGIQDKSPSQKPTTKSDSNYSYKKQEETNKIFCQEVICLIPEVFVNFKKLKDSPMDSSTITELHRFIIAMDNSAEVVDCSSTKEYINIIRTKLDWVVKGSGILIDAETYELMELFNLFLKSVEEMAISLNLDFSLDEMVVSAQVNEPHSVDTPLKKLFRMIILKNQRKNLILSSILLLLKTIYQRLLKNLQI